MSPDTRSVGRAAIQKATSSGALGNLEIQRSIREREPSQVRAIANRGMTGAASELPHHALIQRSFGRHDISHARAHMGSAAAAAADQMDASAYTVGDQVAFASPPGLRTAAHEAAHVVQQGGGVQLEGGVGQADDRYERHADAVAERVVHGESSEALLDEVTPDMAAVGTRGVQRAPKFAPLYGGNAVADAQAYKDSIGTTEDRPTMKPASKWEKNGKTGSKVAAFRMSKEEILQVITAAESALAVDSILGKPGSAERTMHESQIASYVSKMTEAFEIMQIDTIEAQADFVAHAVGETLLSKLTEGQTKTFVDDPASVSASVSLDADSSGTIRGPRRYRGKSLIDPLGVITQAGPMDPALFRRTFIGRGPIQVTDRTNYLHSLMYLELRADELQHQLDALPPDPSPLRTKLTAQIALLREAVDKISADPSLAADPKYAYLFSAAFMQSSSALRDSIAGFGSTHDFTKSAGFSGGFKDDRGKAKTGAYKKAYEILLSHMTPAEFVDATVGKFPQPGPSPWTKELEVSTP